MKIASVGVKYYLFPVKELKEDQIINEEIHPVDMNNIAFLQVMKTGKRKRVSFASPKRDAVNFDPLYHIPARQGLPGAKVPVEGENLNTISLIVLPAGQIKNKSLSPPHTGMKLTTYVQYIHF